MDIYIIKNGAVVSYLQESYFDSQLPILPSEVDFVELTWKAEVEPVREKISDVSIRFMVTPSDIYVFLSTFESMFIYWF